jgi:hypothetical protein
VLTGHVLKDTDYVMQYHNDSLMAPDNTRIAGNFANRPIRTSASIGAIKSVLSAL